MAWSACEDCHSVLVVTWNICPFCGTITPDAEMGPREEARCEECGTHMAWDWSYCPNCGTDYLVVES